MRLLLDTHILLWAAGAPEKLSSRARGALNADDNQLMFSVVSLWEIAIKNGLGRNEFQVDPRLLRRGLSDNGYEELPVMGAHVLALDALPPLHKDPFDRMLIAQATAEGITLLTADKLLASYGAPVRRV